MGWQVELKLKVKGPDEGPVIITVEYPDTTKETALLLQNSLAQLGLQLNDVKKK